MKNKSALKYIVVLTGIILITSGILTFKKTEDPNNNKITSKLYVENNIIYITETDKLIEFDINTLEEETPVSKNDGYLPVLINLKYENDTVEVLGEIRVQGSSTAFWPKKELDIKVLF